MRDAVRVKICGITRWEDGLAAARAGAHAIGFVFAPSSRRVSPEQARDIARRLPPLLCRVGVFVDAAPDEIEQVAASVGLDAVQLHGREGPEVVEEVRRRTGCRIIKAVRAQDAADLEKLPRYGADALLLDSYHPRMAGGTGVPFPWEWVRNVPRGEGELWLAGGLRPDNVRAALEQAQPDGVDVSSGVEAAPGIKDGERVRRFLREVRRFELAAIDRA